MSFYRTMRPDMGHKALLLEKHFPKPTDKTSCD